MNPARELAHEVQGPLAALEARLESLAQHHPGSELVEGCLGEVAALKALVVDFLELEAAGAGREPAPEDGVFNVSELFVELERRYRPVAEARGIRLDVDRPGDAGAMARGTSRAAARIVGNLLDNAIKFSRRNETVRLEVSRETDALRILVKDEGDGMPPEVQRRVFEPFYRADRDQPGSGLGLAIARRLAEAAGGRLEVESAPGGGSVFTLTLETPRQCPSQLSD